MRFFKGLAALGLSIGLSACGDGANLPDSSRQNGLTSDEQSAPDDESANEENEDSEDDEASSGEDGEGSESHSECYDVGEGERECVVHDGDTVCVFVYDDEGEVEGECFAADEDSEDEGDEEGEDDDEDADHEDGDDESGEEEEEDCPGEDGDWGDWGEDDSAEDPSDGDDHPGEEVCTEAEDGSGSCTFDDGNGHSCTVSWDASGHLTEDCSEQALPPEPSQP